MAWRYVKSWRDFWMLRSQGQLSERQELAWSGPACGNGWMPYE